MQNIRGLLLSLLQSRMAPAHLGELAAAVSLCFAVLIITVVFRGQRHISELGFSLVIVVTVLSGFHGYMHDTVLLLLPLFLVADYVDRTDLSGNRLFLVASAGVTFFAPSLVSAPGIVVALLLFCSALIAESMCAQHTNATPLSVVRESV